MCIGSAIFGYPYFYSIYQQPALRSQNIEPARAHWSAHTNYSFHTFIWLFELTSGIVVLIFFIYHCFDAFDANATLKQREPELNPAPTQIRLCLRNVAYNKKLFWANTLFDILLLKM